MKTKASINELFFVFQETDLDNEDIYLPPDTPTDKTNQKRLKTIYKKQHARQRERLLNQQVAELDNYRKDFSKKYKDDLLYTCSETPCESMSGSDFLIHHNADIMELLAMIPEMSNNVQQDSAMTEMLDPAVPEKKFLALPPPPSRLEGSSDDDMDTSEDEESLNDADDKHDGGGGCDEVILRKKERNSKILKKKSRKGFSRLAKLHARQYKMLQEIQKEDLVAFPDDAPPPATSLGEVDVVVEKRGEDESRLKAKEKEKGRMKHKHHTAVGRANEQQREALNSAHVIAHQLLEDLNRKANPNITNPNRLEQKRSMDENINRSTNNYNTDPRPKVPMMKAFPKALSKSAAIMTSQPLPVKTTKPPVVTLSGPPVVNSAGPPVVATSNSGGGGSSSNSSSNSNSANYNNGSRMNKQIRGDSNQPLYDSIPKKFKPKTLLDKKNGFINVKNKPDRVIINGTDYGAPKDFDDAINGICRTDNAIHRRQLCGEVYLYYKSPQGHLTALGTVSKIQPYIHKFLLTR